MASRRKWLGQCEWRLIRLSVFILFACLFSASCQGITPPNGMVAWAAQIERETEAQLGTRGRVSFREQNGELSDVTLRFVATSKLEAMTVAELLKDAYSIVTTAIPTKPKRISVLLEIEAPSQSER